MLGILVLFEPLCMLIVPECVSHIMKYQQTVHWNTDNLFKLWSSLDVYQYITMLANIVSNVWLMMPALINISV